MYVLDKAKDCPCGNKPVLYLPMYWGNEKMSQSAKKELSCEKCGRSVFIEDSEPESELLEKWNSIDAKP